MFRSFDDNGDGRLNIDEFPNALSLIGVHPTHDDLKDLLRLFDRQGRITPEWFLVDMLTKT